MIAKRGRRRIPRTIDDARREGVSAFKELMRAQIAVLVDANRELSQVIARNGTRPKRGPRKGAGAPTKTKVSVQRDARRARLMRAYVRWVTAALHIMNLQNSRRVSLKGLHSKIRTNLGTRFARGDKAIDEMLYRPSRKRSPKS